MPHSPAHLNIPPTDAVPVPTGSKLFRFVSKAKPDGSDFLPSCMDPRQRRMHSKRSHIAEFHGTSFFLSKEAADAKREERPQAFINLQLAAGIVESNHGLSKIGRAEHVTLWFYEGIYPDGFELI